MADQQKHIERALQAAEIRRRAVLENIVDGIITINESGIVQDFNRAAEKIFGYKADEVVGHNINKLMPNPYAEEHDGYLSNYVETGNAKIIGIGREVEGMRKDGSTFPLELAVSEMLIDGERLFSGIVRDITERKNIERTLRATETRQRAVLEHTVDGIITINESGIVQDFNLAAEKIFGYQADEVIGNNINVLMPNPYAREHDSYLKNYFQTGKARIIGIGRDVEGMRKDGSTFPLELAVSEMVIDGERLFSGIVRDITERKKSEQALIEARNFAEDSARSKADFLANMSHEIRTPMNAIINLSYLALKGETDNKTYDYIKKIQSASKNLLGIINDILDFSKIEARSLVLEAIPFNLHSVLNDLATVIGYRALENYIEVLFHIDTKVPTYLLGDPLRLSQILTNLISNAIKFTQKGEVVLTVSVAGIKDDIYSIEFCISDTGIGMNEEQQANLFQPFKQADGSISRKYGGTGLGLVISRYLVDLMHGEITVESQLGKGSIFKFTIPIQQDIQTEKNAEKLMDLSNIRVLVVDDNSTARLIATDTLVAMGIQTDAIESGTKALEILQKNDAATIYDVVLLDWRMPGLDGHETMIRIREDSQIKIKPKIILCTAFGIEVVREQSRKHQADGYLGKPYNNSTLLNAILNCLKHTLQSKSKPENAGKANVKEMKKIVGKRILLVDDNEINQMIAIDLLDSVGVEVTAAGSAKECFECLEQQQFDLVLMDIQMPEIDGLEATRIIRNDARFDCIPIIAMTAHAMESDREKSLAAGMNGHLTKPIDPDELYKTVIQWTNKKPMRETVAENTIVQDELPESIKGIDLKVGLAQVRGNGALFRKLLIKFVEQYADASDKFEKLMGKNAQEDAIRLVHSIKG
ncbi:MAG: PAS domain S-box protein, partial [Gammaproteobacteria bacterium]|nr:PAS domain S-box protein [Gammaproteobacteria bacterium]